MVFQLSTVFQKNFPLVYSSFPNREELTDRISRVSEKILRAGIFTVASWALCWMNPRIAPLGFICGFILRKPVQWMMDDLRAEYRQHFKWSNASVYFITVSVFLSNLMTFPITIPVAIFASSVGLGTFARDEIFSSQNSSANA